MKISIINDDLFEGRETFFVYLKSGVDVSLLSNAQAEVVILDDGMMCIQDYMKFSSTYIVLFTIVYRNWMVSKCNRDIRVWDIQLA